MLEKARAGRGVQTTEEVQAFCKIHSKNFMAKRFLVDGGIVGEDFRCPECIREAEAITAEIESRKEAVRRKNALIANFRRSGVEQEYLSKTFENFEHTNPSQEDALKLCRKFVLGWEKAKEHGYGLLLSGGCGTGKTHLANAVMKELITRRGIKARYARVAEIIRDVRATWSGKGEFTEEEALRKYCDLDLLVIDELGVQAGSSNEQQILFAIIDRRLAEAKPVICLTNLNPAELEEVLGERLMDRLKSKCVSRIITGKSYRTPIDDTVFD